MNTNQIKLNIDRFLDQTQGLSCEDRDAYVLLFMAMVQNGGFLNLKAAEYADIVGMSLGKWRKLKKRLAHLLVFEGREISAHWFQLDMGF